MLGRFRNFLLALTTAVVAACGGGGSSVGSGTLVVKMTDAPAAQDYAEVWVTVERIRVHRADTDDQQDQGWSEIVLDPPKKVDLLTLRNGVTVELGELELTAGDYTQIRLVLGKGPMDNTVVLASDPGVEIPMTTPSGQASGLKLIHPFHVGDGETVELTLDFDAMRSVVLTGSGKYLLKPTIAVIPTVGGSGAPAAATMAGSFGDDSANGASVSLQAYDPSTDTVSIARSTGVASRAWTLDSVPPGTYNLVISKAGFRTVVLTGVELAAGDSIGPVDLPGLEVLSTPRAASGSVVPADAAASKAAEVSALQRVVDDTGTADDLLVRVAMVMTPGDTGIFDFALAADPAMVAPFVVGSPVFVDGANPGLYRLDAIGVDAATGSGSLGVDLSAADQAGLEIATAP